MQLPMKERKQSYCKNACYKEFSKARSQRQESSQNKKANERARLLAITLGTKLQEYLELEKERASRRKVRLEVIQRPGMQDENCKNASTN